jgi:uncharacterized damage-inducible protein DinB
MPPANPEPWLRGPLPGVPPLLMPAAHALLQAREDVSHVLAELSTDDLWQRPGGAASAGFHVRHLAGALDRLLTYARGEALDDAQKRTAAAEGREVGLDAASLREEIDRAIDAALAQIRATREEDLLEPRGVGRHQLPSNVIGLVFHAAEHATRHAGQALTIAKIVRAERRSVD